MCRRQFHSDVDVAGLQSEVLGLVADRVTVYTNQEPQMGSLDDVFWGRKL